MLASFSKSLLRFILVRTLESITTMSQNDELIPMAVASSSVPPLTPKWVELPRDVTANILQRLGAVDIQQSAENVCTSWRRICADPAMWRVLHIDYTTWRRTSADPATWRVLHMDDRYWNRYLMVLWRRAVDRSQGQLLDLSIKYIGDDDLLNYIADRSNGLKRLTINNSGIQREGLNEAVKKLSQLEELRLVKIPSLKAEDLINIGISCPNLKSFTLNLKGFSSLYYTDFAKEGPISNEYALAIAGNMPNQCHLSLNANPIGSEGLEAILDGCPNLESLDLRQCFHLHGAISRRCSEQIKLLKLPLDHVSLIEYQGAPNHMYSDDDDDAYCFDYETFNDSE